MASNEELFEIGFQIVSEIVKTEISKMCEKKKRKRKLWTRDWILQRPQFGLSEQLLEKVRYEDPKTYINHLRMTPAKFDELLSLIENDIAKKNTFFRDAIPARIKLEITLRYIASGDSFSSLEHAYRVPKCTISQFLIPVLKAIFDKLKFFIKTPSSENEWRSIADGFSTRWNFPNCCGAIDGKHIRMKCPPATNSDFINYKGFFSTVLFAVVDSNYRFIFIDVGKNGRVNDSTIFKESSLKTCIENGYINFPNWGVVVGDDAFPLSKYLMKPYSHHGPLTKEERIFNYRLSRARRVVENSFGILASRFRIFTRPIDLLPEKVDEIVKACCCIHNWLRTTDCKVYIPNGCVDVENMDTGEITPGQWRKEIADEQLLQSVKDLSGNNYSKAASSIRETYKNYFMTTGAVDWQWQKIE